MAEVGKPGTNWVQVTPEHRKKIAAIVNYYAKKPHPFTECVRDNRKRFGPRTEQVCAVVKDMGRRSTKWRKGNTKSLSVPSDMLLKIDLSQVRTDLVRLANEVEPSRTIDLANWQP
jgi:hypothetical protein